MSEKTSKNKFSVIFIALVLIFILIKMVLSVPTFGSNFGTTSYFLEDQSPVFSYNFSTNVTDPENGTWSFSLLGINSTFYPNQQNISFYYWFSINSLTGLMKINATKDNQTGRFNLSAQVLNQDLYGESRPFYFIANATNDAPNFTSISSVYNFPPENISEYYINATDEENHHPLYFNISFFNNCTHASWWNGTGSCAPFSIINFSNNSALINYTYSKNDVGSYYANASVMDFGQNYTCSSGYCSQDYSQNKTTYYSQIITFNVLSTLEINASDCQNRIFQENTFNSCRVNITTRGANNSINISSRAALRNYASNVSNTSWFYSNNLTSSQNYTLTVTINVTPGKTEIGNWTINFTVSDITSNQNLTEQIYIYVNRTYNAGPNLASINNLNTSIDLFTRINITAYDDDFLVPDKLQGYNESINFTSRVFNQSNLSQELSLANFSVQILYMPVSGTNRSEGKIEFTPNSSEAGNYFVNITATDRNNNISSRTFNLSVIMNNAPVWNSSMQNIFILWENNNTYINISQNVSDPNGDSLTFSFTNDTSFPSFSLNSLTGIINFTPVDSDIGQHLVTITASDGYLANSTTLNFTIRNINDSPYIEKPFQSSDIINASVDSNSNITAIEDNRTSIYLWIQDDDFKIPSSQKSFYNESLRLNVTIQGPNTSLLLFTRNPAFPTEGNNRSKYEAVFTPKKTDVGSYNITVNVSDNSNLSDIFYFRVVINSIEHSPVLMNLTNQISAVNRSFYYRINATDIEDGNTTAPGGNSNFTFSYNFLNGTDFINNNWSIFNRTTGEINITFNSSQGVSYRINITVNDSSGRIDYDSFWIYVYDIPVINFPPSSYQFNLNENQSYNLSFQANHSILDNLTYEFYIQGLGGNYLRYNTSYYGNNSNFSWSLSTNFSDETYGIKNLTLIVYPSNSSLLNRISLNLTRIWNLTINHTNSPLGFSGYIGGSYQNITSGSPYELALSDFFYDLDASDIYHNQTINFTVNLLNSSSGSITTSVRNWTSQTLPMVTFSASVDSRANFSITAYEYNESNISQILSNVTSNNFSLYLKVTTTQTTVTTTTSGGGGGYIGEVKTPVAFKIIAPGRISAFAYQKITVPISLVNNGKSSFNNITLTSVAFKDGKIANVVKTSLSKDYVASLLPGKTENLTLDIFFDTNKSGDYEVLLNATSKSPVYSDWTKIYINLQKVNESEIKRYLLFVEEYLVENPNCLELMEMLDEANRYFEAGEFSNARAKAEAVLNSCKEYVSQASLPKSKFPSRYSIEKYVVIASLISFIAGILYYYAKRRKLRLKKFAKAYNASKEKNT